MKRIFPKQNAAERKRYRNFAVKEIQSGSRFSKAAYEGYKAYGGTLTFNQIKKNKK